MKANEAPEKIYMPTELLSEEWTRHIEGQDIEYIRKDAFIEKAWCWIEDNILSSNQQDKSHLYFEQFKKYMKGE